MLTANTVTRRGKFDAAHRVLHERFQCYNLHGHEYRYELTFTWEKALALGYAIDFKEIKRVGCHWIDLRMDHGFLANPHDDRFLATCRELKLKIYEMSLVDESGFGNPTAENIAKELFFAMSTLLDSSGLRMSGVRLWETENCVVDCGGLSEAEMRQLRRSPLFFDLVRWRQDHGVVEYDGRIAAESAAAGLSP